ncbi:hypothetical protein T4D_2737 [Trichinella pseudospiralis]|uniref:Uncharacterized protein n=1 Tax=Trichinella pseudospiralis TaxID=6337 RepID=A0A0V1FKX7_TRIPS|nr:hypothetical protein T4D_2737 [Trichinella pseudospiralis]
MNKAICWRQRSVANKAVDCRLFSAAGQTNYDRLTAILPTFDPERVTNKTNNSGHRLGTTQNQEQSHGTVKKSLTTTAASYTLHVTFSYRTPPTVLIVKFAAFRFQQTPPRWTMVHYDDWAGSTKIKDLTNLVIIPLETFTRAERATPSMPS